MKAFEVVLEHVEQGIMSGEYVVGGALPPEREFAAQLGVSRAAVREAIRALEAQGVLTSVVGAGAGSGTRFTDLRSDALARLLRLHVSLGKYPASDVVETRVTLERQTAELAARNATPATVRLLRTMLDEMHHADELADFNRLDTEFHVVLARAGGNPLVTDLTVAVREALRRPIREASERMDDWLWFRDKLLAQHEAIFEAVRDGDAAAAASAMEAHIRGAYALLPAFDAAAGGQGQDGA